MFTKAFARMLDSSAAGNPAFVATPIRMSARLIAQHPTVTNAVFALVQLLLALGIGWRPTLRFALASSVVWSAAVWWLGEGLGGVLSGSASPVNGAPGPAILYALLAVLLWPGRRDREAPFAAGQFTGPSVARVLWIALWGSLALFALLPATSAPGALARMISSASASQPAWLSALDAHLATFLASQGPIAAFVGASALFAVAVGICLPMPASRAAPIVAIVIALVLSVAQGLGGILIGSSTDPGSGPLLALIALCYWQPRPKDGEAAMTTQRSA